MILDSKLLFGANKAIIGSASAVVKFSNQIQLDAVKRFLTNNASGNPIIPGSVPNDVGRAGDIMLNARITSTQFAASSTTATLELNLYEHTAAASISSGSLVYQTVVQGITKAGSSSASIASHCKLGNYVLKARIPKNLWGDTTNKFIGFTTKVITAKINTGKLTVWLGRADDQLLP